LFGAVAVLVCIYLSGHFGVKMAKEQFPETKSQNIDRQSNIPMTLGDSGEPVFLADSPTALRRFFSESPSPESRLSADLTGSGIRRLRGKVNVTTMGTEADAVKVQITSGAIEGSVYWIHHSQIPDTEEFDPIISPIPGVPVE
tara:strand:+ start:4640 stop:5068 length:429 start_codon:yes stop_codon:yes gene_type:complete